METVLVKLISQTSIKDFVTANEECLIIECHKADILSALITVLMIPANFGIGNFGIPTGLYTCSHTNSDPDLQDNYLEAITPIFYLNKEPARTPDNVRNTLDLVAQLIGYPIPELPQAVLHVLPRY
ncbi:hypothetical protein GGI20_005135 [Coemansia sp. BCRC 34301]|nr:hypothetical protein GGI20_005135 [Coemansia sp. BCRC 34301]